ncbi:hypothetical protein EDD37DRAFT_644914 [Exophiala viscosa]|uniref:uncharacterized protein n=1 Tax=Exophiala viscosa TaxID=2486360 RepID=UPI002196651B|nr:hypothetical protein EDD37DRAFT_644914 [Exophiala viscosa]
MQLKCQFRFTSDDADLFMWTFNHELSTFLSFLYYLWDLLLFIIRSHQPTISGPDSILALTMPLKINIITLFLCMIISALALPPQLQKYLSGERTLPAWAHEAKPASLHHNLYSDTALPVSDKIEGPVTEATSALPSAPTSLLPWLQSAE